jgi:hypothetical protein
MSEFEKTCTYCKAKIKLSDNKGGKWLPYNLDNSPHDCRTKKQEPTSTQNNGVKLAEIIKTIQSVVKELELLQKA